MYTCPQAVVHIYIYISGKKCKQFNIKYKIHRTLGIIIGII